MRGLLASGWTGLAALLLVCSAVAGCGSPSSDSETHTDFGRRMVDGPIDSADDARLSLAELLERGEELHFADEIDSARVVFSRVLDRTSTGGNARARARALTWLGLGAWRRWDLDEARRLGEEALALKLQKGFPAELAVSYNALGLTAWTDGRLADAIELYTLAYEHARAANDRETLTKAVGNLGLVQVEYGDFSQARQNLETQARMGRETLHRRLEANALTNLAMLDVLEGAPRRAVERLQDALSLYRVIGYGTGVENALAQLGTAHRDLGDFSRAHAAFDSALALARRLEYPDAEAQNLELRAELYAMAGDYERALRFFAEARTINEVIGDDVYAGIDARHEAETLASIDDVASAAEKAHEALVLHRSADARFEEFRDLLLIAELAVGSDTAGGESALREALALADDLDTPVADAALALTRARMAASRGDHREVLANTAGIVSTLEERDHASQWEAWSLRARAFRQLGALDSAVADGRRAVDLIERARARVGSGPLRSSYASARVETYTDLTIALLRSGKTYEAFQIADALRVRGYGARAGHLEFSADAERLQRQVDYLTLALDSMRALPRNEVDEPTVRGMSVELARARQRYEDLLIRLSEEHAARSTAVGLVPLQPAVLQATLRGDETVLEYLVTPERLVIFVMTREDLAVAEVPIPEASLRTRVRMARELISDPESDGSRRDKVLAGLHQALIEPAFRDHAPSGTRLIVIPHAVLSYLPFAALRDEASGRYLVEAFSVAHAPSAAALLFMRSGVRRSASTGGLGIQVFAPFPLDLPASGREAEWVSKGSAAATLALGPEATEARLRASLAAEGVVHVATYGVLNARSPMFSRLEMWRGTDRPDDDGRLEMHEVLELDVGADLVYLSGCETALGPSWSTEFAEGQDYATLAQAFLLSGAGGVVATLWRVEDLGSAVFARAFYEALADGAPEDALARAQRELIASADYGSPYYWAAYRLSGGAGSVHEHVVVGADPATRVSGYRPGAD